MRKNEIETVKLFLIDLLKIEENQYFKNNEEKIFYLKHKVSFTPYNFTFYDEPFYIICQINNWGIYYNDIEETFGICKIVNNECNESVEFFDNLAPTVRKIKTAYEENNMNSLFK
ncbi:hypothetical protein MNB_SV-3-1396 [hydrothermal vent metagenome]|uniref:Uncharacterized protein n=1 Tax=hydrothermal vent metagenome TaxID=652676 RepID=A0A1W1BWB3_9ZZZZ